MRKTILLPIVTLMVIMMAGLVSATPQLALVQSIWNDGTNVNLSTKDVNDGSLVNMSYITLYAACPSSVQDANLTIGTVWNISNSTATNFDLGYANFTFGRDIVIYDGKCSITGTSTRGTNGTAESLISLSATTITIDRTVPTCALDSVLVSSETYAPTQTWSATCVNATSATIKFGTNTAIAMVENSDLCTYTGDKKSVPQGTYKTLQVTSSDGANTTSCTQLSSIRIDIGVPLKEIAAILASQSEEKAGTGTGTKTNNSMVMIVIFGLAAFWWVRRNKN